MTSRDPSRIRKEYLRHELKDSQAGDDPFDLFAFWFMEAVRVEGQDANVMCLSTADEAGRPSARMVLLKGFSHDGFSFFTNFRSRKGRELEARPYAALTFYWHDMERQVRISGSVSKLSPKESNEYFNARPADSRISAIISPQSQAIPSRDWLENKRKSWVDGHDLTKIKRPANWGGYRVIPDTIEFWQGRENRLHDRILFTLDSGTWQRSRLAP
jgi:pyridoxamine 5'-phosphate oxidase